VIIWFLYGVDRHPDFFAIIVHLCLSVCLSVSMFVCPTWQCCYCY